MRYWQQKLSTKFGMILSVLTVCVDNLGHFNASESYQVQIHSDGSLKTSQQLKHIWVVMEEWTTPELCAHESTTFSSHMLSTGCWCIHILKYLEAPPGTMARICKVEFLKSKIYIFNILNVERVSSNEYVWCVIDMPKASICTLVHFDMSIVNLSINITVGHLMPTWIFLFIVRKLWKSYLVLKFR